MIAEALPGTGLSELITLLRQVQADMNQVRAPRTPREAHIAYIRWASSSIERLWGRVTPESLDQLVQTRRYWLLQEMSDQSDLEQVTRLRNLEVTSRERLLDEALRELITSQARWSRHGRWIVPDTSFYVSHPQTVDALEVEGDLKAGLRLLGDEELRVLVPILVVDELDNLKRDGRVRGQAQRALAILARLLTNPHVPALLRPAEELNTKTAGWGFLRGEVTIELLLDPRGHTRLPIADDELVSRAVAVQTLIGQSVYLLTYDTGQAFRAKAAGLEAVLLRTSET